ncbi:MAG: polysaccharide deacetylase family protein [Planctomycetes bacterium]|nr:polysaccharide deacetylase family protein [Planctomycetota bacterium]
MAARRAAGDAKHAIPEQRLDDERIIVLALADSVLLTPRFLQSVFGLKRAIRSTLRARFAKSVLDRRPALIVLLYHAVDPSPPQYLRDLGVVTHPHAFEDHLLWAKSCFELVSLSEGIRRLRSGTLTKTCLALTFDDGLKSVADHALPVLIRHGIPAALFVNHASLTGQRCWIYDVAQLESEGRKEALEEVFGTSCPGLFSSYLRHQAPADVLARRSGLTDLSSSLNGNRVEYINHEELAQLLESPLMELGNHSLDHPRFSRLDANEQCRQINGNAEALAGFAGYQRFFALPFGRPADWNMDTVQACAAARHEFVSACGGVNFARTASIDIRRVPCDGVGGGQLMDHITRRGIGI